MSTPQPAKPIVLMGFGEYDQLPFCDLVLGHWPFVELLELAKTKYPGQAFPDGMLRYEYASFQNNEAVLLNCRPTEPGAKPVTVIYHRWIPGQDE